MKTSKWLNSMEVLWKDLRIWFNNLTIFILDPRRPRQRFPKFLSTWLTPNHVSRSTIKKKKTFSRFIVFSFIIRSPFLLIVLFLFPTLVLFTLFFFVLHSYFFSRFSILSFYFRSHYLPWEEIDDEEDEDEERGGEEEQENIRQSEKNILHAITTSPSQ